MSTNRNDGRSAPVSKSHRVAVIGAGYVGLPTAAILAHFGHQVVCAERDPARFSMLNRGEMPIVEPGLEEMVRDGVERGHLRFDDQAARAVLDAEFVFLCVATPPGDDGSADLSYVEAVALEIAPHLAENAIIVNKSTVPVGTANLVKGLTDRHDVSVVSNPEFLREGSAITDSLNPDRIVVGADDRAAAARVGDLFSSTGAPLIVTDTTTSETIKYASNAFLATKLSFINAMARLCEAVEADVRDVILGLGYDKRIGFDFLRPGPGWGGSCLPKDTLALGNIAKNAGYDFALLRAAISANEEQLEAVVDKVQRALGDDFASGPVALLGLTFKARTDDRRSSPAVDIANRLLARGASLRAFDPTVEAGATAADLEHIEICADPYEACRGAQVAVVLTEWDEFRAIDFQKLFDLMAQASVVDARNLLDPAALRRIGFTYTGIGRP
jgi:UDPglucose 6-dehydrogenase